jgi:hypothetical protein
VRVPLISRVREWIARRNADITYGGAEAAGLAWIVMWPIVLILLPVLLFLVLVGLVYEGLVRIDRQRRLDGWTL